MSSSVPLHYPYTYRGSAWAEYSSFLYYMHTTAAESWYAAWVSMGLRLSRTIDGPSPESEDEAWRELRARAYCRGCRADGSPFGLLAPGHPLIKKVAS